MKEQSGEVYHRFCSSFSDKSIENTYQICQKHKDGKESLCILVSTIDISNNLKGPEKSKHQKFTKLIFINLTCGT